MLLAAAFVANKLLPPPAVAVRLLTVADSVKVDPDVTDIAPAAPLPTVTVPVLVPVLIDVLLFTLLLIDVVPAIVFVPPVKPMLFVPIAVLFKPTILPVPLNDTKFVPVPNALLLNI